MGNKAVLIPVFNEEKYVTEVLTELRIWHKCDIVVINDGSSDCSGHFLSQLPVERLTVINHPTNLGYGRSLIDGFKIAIERGYEAVVTMDCDWQHQPHYVPAFFEALEDVDVVSGSRYLREFKGDDAAPSDRRNINQIITHQVNELTGYGITDAFCGFKGYRVSALKKLQLDESGYAFPLQFWIQAKHFGLTVKELAVPRVYIDFNRTFGEDLNDPNVRLAHYREVLDTEIRRWQKQ